MELVTTEAAGLQARAESAYAQGRLEEAIACFEDLYGLHRRAGDDTAAAEAATSVAMYLMMDTGLMSPVRGWARRAETLLEGTEESGAHAWLDMVRAYERLMCGDLDEAARFAARAIDVGTRHHQPAPATIARIAAARLRIFAGDVEEGLALLDEAAVTVASGELGPLPTGMAWCELICAMQGLAQYDRAEEWTAAMELWRHGTAFGGINGRCRVHRAEILRLRGACDEAEEEALHACEELRPWMRREFGWPLTELGTIRLRRGDLPGAEAAFLAAHEHGWEPQPGLALLLLAQGDLGGATSSIADALDRPRDIPSKERPPQGGLRRAPLLEAQAHIASIAGDLSTATRACEELQEVADRFRSRALLASAATSRGRVRLARGDATGAIDELATAVAGWTEVGAPYETAVARRVLGEAHLAAGQPGQARLEFRAAHRGFERIGARLQARETAGLCGPTEEPAPTSAPTPAPTARPATTPHPSTTADPPAGVFRRDGDTWSLGIGGRTVLVRDLKGLRHLARLVAEPGREFHALDLVAVDRGALPGRAPPVEAGTLAASDGDLGPVLDAQAKQAYRRRLLEVEEDIEDAQQMGDAERAALATADRDFILRELSHAVGLGGRDRRPGSTSERARTSVTRSIRYAMSRIAEHHPALAAHLDHAVRTGTYCAYEPDPAAPVAWDVGT